MNIFLEHIDIGDEGLLVHLGLIDHEDGDVLSLYGLSCEKVHVLVGEGDIPNDIVFDLFSFDLHCNDFYN